MNFKKTEKNTEVYAQGKLQGTIAFGKLNLIQKQDISEKQKRIEKLEKELIESKEVKK